MLPAAVVFHAKKLSSFVHKSLVDFVDVHGSVKAGALAYATLISIVPLMVLSLGFILAFPSLSPYFQSLHGFLFRHFIPSSASVIQKHVETFAGNATNLSASGLIFFLISSVLLIFTMETVFNSIWHVQKRRKGLRAFLMYWAVLTLIPPIGVLAVALSVFLNSLPYMPAMMDLLALFLPLTLTFLGYTFLYTTVPNTTVIFRHAALGAGVASILFEIFKEGFRLYVVKFSSDAIVYGVLSVFPMFLLWLYVSWLITIFGAVIAHRAGARPVQSRTPSA